MNTKFRRVVLLVAAWFLVAGNCFCQVTTIPPPPPFRWMSVVAAPSWVAATTAAYDVYAYHLDAQLAVIATAQCQYQSAQLEAVAVVGDETAGYVVTDSRPQWPPVNNELVVSSYTGDGAWRWDVVACSLQVDPMSFYSDVSVCVVDSLVFVGWVEINNDQVRFQRLLASTGQALDGPQGQTICVAYSYSTLQPYGAGVILAAADSVFIVSAQGQVTSQSLAVSRNPITLQVLPEGLLVSGVEVGGLLTAELVTPGITFYYQLSDLGIILPRQVAAEGRMVAYGNSSGYYIRSFSDLGMSDEIVLYQGQESCWDLQAAVGATGVGLTWYNQDSSSVVGQQVTDGQTTWINGLQLGKLQPFGGQVPIATFGSGSFGAVAYVANGGNLVIQPIDDLDVATPHPTDLLPTTVVLLPCYPNPFNAVVTVPFTVDHRQPIELAVYNIQGQRVATLIDEVLVSGSYRIQWQPTGSSGTYVISLRDERGRSDVRTVKYVR